MKEILELDSIQASEVVTEVCSIIETIFSKLKSLRKSRVNHDIHWSERPDIDKEILEDMIVAAVALLDSEHYKYTFDLSDKDKKKVFEDSFYNRSI